MQLLVATHNAGKKREYERLLEGLELSLQTLDELGISEEVEETGETFEANALLKARGYAARTGLVTLADDSGLEVDALDGAPGVRSARYGGPGASDEDRYRLLLRRLERVPDAERNARFCCVIAVSLPDGQAETSEGHCEGRIGNAPRGTHGFGFDPVFLVAEYGHTRTMAELPPEEKNRISHRARAAEGIRPVLAQLAKRPTSS